MKNKIKYLPIGILTLTTTASGFALSATPVIAATSGSKTASVTVAKSCSFSSASTTSSTLSLTAGATSTTEGNTSKTINTVICNTTNGFYVQAVGFSPDATHPDGLEGNTAMYGADGTIPTGTSGADSYWGFKVSNAVSSTNNTPSIVPAYSVYATVPNSPVTIAEYAATTTGVSSGSFRTDYQVHIGADQASGSYSGAVKYIIAVTP